MITLLTTLNHMQLKRNLAIELNEKAWKKRYWRKINYLARQNIFTPKNIKSHSPNQKKLNVHFFFEIVAFWDLMRLLFFNHHIFECGRCEMIDNTHDFVVRIEVQFFVQVHQEEVLLSRHSILEVCWWSYIVSGS